MQTIQEGETEYIPDLIYDHTSRRAIQEERFRKRLGQQVNLKSGEKLFEFGFGTSSQTILLKQAMPCARFTISSKIIGIVMWILLFLLGSHFPLLAQVEDGMLIFELDGNRYMRKNFNKENELSNYQTIEVGNANNQDGKIETKMTVITYDADGTLKDASQTTLVCNPKTKQVLMGIFPFAGGKSQTSLVVKIDKGAIMYPTNWRKLKELDDFNLNLDFEGGAIGFFGTKSTISIKNRKVISLENNFGVQGNIVIRAYLIGINVSTIKYDFFEEIDIQKGIVRQKFTENNGDYFTVEIIE